MKRFIFLASLCAGFISSNAKSGDGWLIRFKPVHDSLIFALRAQPQSLLTGRFIDFDFPAYDITDVPYQNAIQAKLTKDKYYIDISLHSGLYFSPSDPLLVKVRSAMIGIDSVVISGKNKEGQWRRFAMMVPNRRVNFQQTWEVTLNSNDFKNVPLQDIRIAGYTSEENSYLNIGSFHIAKQIQQEYLLKFTHSDSLIDLRSNDFPSVEIISQYIPDFMKRYGNNFSNLSNIELVIPDEATTLEDSLNYVSSFIHMSFENFPFYKDKSHKQSVLKGHKSLIKSSPDITAYYRGVKDLVVRLRNTHMRFYLSDEDYVGEPIRFFRSHDDKIRVAAVLNKKYAAIEENYELIEINGIPTLDLLPALHPAVFGSTPHQIESKILQHLLQHAINHLEKPLELTFRSKTDKAHISISKEDILGSKVNRLPPNFRPLRREHAEKKEDIFFLRFGMEQGSIPFFISHLEEIKNSRSLIIDVRGVPGGDFSYYSILKYFLPNDTFNTITYPVVQPNSFFKEHEKYVTDQIPTVSNFKFKGNIAILVDERTACAAEAFTLTLKKLIPDRVILIGRSPTAGSLQLTRDIWLPSTTSGLQTNLIFFSGFTYLFEENFDKVYQNGLQPDLLVEINSAVDLVPYSDRVRASAYRYLQKKVSNRMPE